MELMRSSAPVSIALGLLILLTAWLPLVVRRLPLSLPIVAVALGFVLSQPLGIDRHLNIFSKNTSLESISEFVILIALMGVGLRIERPFA
jgi:ABC-type microcin C transport system permease subunit YejB